MSKYCSGIYEVLSGNIDFELFILVSAERENDLRLLPVIWLENRGSFVLVIIRLAILMVFVKGNIHIQEVSLMLLPYLLPFYLVISIYLIPFRTALVLSRIEEHIVFEVFFEDVSVGFTHVFLVDLLY